MRRFKFSDSTSNKFWEVEVKGETLYVTFGEIGTKDFATPEIAKAEMEKLIKEKTSKGYVEAGGKAAKAIKPAAKLPSSKKANVGSMGEGLSKVEKQAKAEKVLAMFAGGQWEMARAILESAQDEHWLFEELLDGCDVKNGDPIPSKLINKGYQIHEYDRSNLVMFEVLSHLPKDLEKLQKLKKRIGVTIKTEGLTKYWKDILSKKFGIFCCHNPDFFSDDWHKEREVEIAKVEKECEARSKALNKAWREEEDLGDGVKLEMVLIPAGKFMMGSPSNEEGRNDNETQHQVTLTKPFYMGKYEVTQEQWEAVMGESYHSDDFYPIGTKGAKLPVEVPTWNDCKEFIKKLNGITKRKYRLPTEAEWEYACRAGTKTVYSFGNKITLKDANYGSATSIGNPVEVGSYKPNAFGLYDMHGNVWEWCEDRCDWNYPSEPVTDPKGPVTGKERVLRGGSYGYKERTARSSNRLSDSPSSPYYQSQVGFRLVRTI